MRLRAQARLTGLGGGNGVKVRAGAGVCRTGLDFFFGWAPPDFFFLRFLGRSRKSSTTYCCAEARWRHQWTRTMASGEMSALHNLRIQELERAVALCADAADTQKQLEMQKEQFTTDMDKLHGSVTPLELGKTLHQAQNDIAERMKLMEGTINLKIDRSEMANLQTMATSLEEYDYFRTETQATLVEQRETNRKNNDTFGNIERSLKQAEKERVEPMQEPGRRPWVCLVSRPWWYA